MCIQYFFLLASRSVFDVLITVIATLRSSGQSKFAKCYCLAADCVSKEDSITREIISVLLPNSCYEHCDSLTVERLLRKGQIDIASGRTFFFPCFFQRFCSRFGRFVRESWSTNLTKKNYVKPSNSRNMISLSFAQT